MQLQLRYVVDYFDEKLDAILKEHEIKYERCRNDPRVDSSQDWMIIYLIQDKENDQEAISYIENYCRSSLTTELVGTEKELREAQWLTVMAHTERLSHFDEKQQENFVYSCNYGHRIYRKTRIETTRDMKPFNKPMFFQALEFDYYEFFCNGFAKKILENANLPVKFEPVYNSRKKAFSPDVFYVDPIYELPMEALDLSNLEKKTCPFCGKELYTFNVSEQLQVKEGYLNKEIGIYKTPSIFVPGGGVSLRVISNDVYRLMEKFGLKRRMKFIVVNEIKNMDSSQEDMILRRTT